MHGKGSLLDKMPGDRWQKFANLRALYAYMWAHPGKKLLFMGGELGEWEEWNDERILDWNLLEYAEHAGLQRARARPQPRLPAEPALWELDFDPAGFRWLEANDAANNVLAFARLGDGDAPPLVCVLQPLAGAAPRLPRRACRVAAAGARCSTPTRPSTAAAASATSAASRRRRCRGTSSHSRPR